MWRIAKSDNVKLMLCYTARMERRTLTIDRTPPRRLLAGPRWRSLKKNADWLVWEQCLAPAQALVDDGYRVERVLITWGSSRPTVDVETVKRLCLAGPDAAFLWDWQPSARAGTTLLELVRD